MCRSGNLLSMVDSRTLFELSTQKLLKEGFEIAVASGHDEIVKVMIVKVMMNLGEFMLLKRVDLSDNTALVNWYKNNHRWRYLGERVFLWVENSSHPSNPVIQILLFPILFLLTLCCLFAIMVIYPPKWKRIDREDVFADD